MEKSPNIYNQLLVILGPTATGKTKLAVQLADKLNGEIISADSRQLYKGMDIGTGKDLNEYIINKKKISYHLIDILDPNDEYNVFQFQKDCQYNISSIKEKGKLPILCGGTALYIKAILMNFELPAVRPNDNLREELDKWHINDLIKKLKSISPNFSEHYLVDTKRRVIRAIEIEMSTEVKTNNNIQYTIKNPIVLGIEYPRETIRKRITKRLDSRLNQGMIKEVESLLDNGITHQKLERFGLEYRFISYYIQKKLSKEEMIDKLNIAIHQFSKRQMTFFRNIEKNNVKIHWIPEGNVEKSLDVITKSGISF